MEDNVNHPKPVWLKPKENFTKVTFDAGFYKDIGEGSWGFVARTDKGEFIAAAAGKLRHLRDALQAEAEACVMVTEGAAAMGLHRVIFESDCQTLVKALNSSSHELAEIGILLREARSICHSAFEAFEFNFCPRTCNRVAHELAQSGFRSEVECVGWAENSPSFVTDLLASDSAEPSG
jgi:ribonuclease HI